MARTFASASSERVYFGVGGLTANQQSVALSYGVIFRLGAISGFQTLLCTNSSAAAAGTCQVALATNGDDLLIENTGGSQSLPNVLAANTWYVAWFTKASGNVTA